MAFRLFIFVVFLLLLAESIRAQPVFLEVSWTPTTTRENGQPFNPISDLDRYDVCEMSPTLECLSVLRSTRSTSEVFETETGATNCFAIRTIDTEGRESNLSTTVCVVSN